MYPPKTPLKERDSTDHRSEPRPTLSLTSVSKRDSSAGKQGVKLRSDHQPRVTPRKPSAGNPRSATTPRKPTAKPTAKPGVKLNPAAQSGNTADHHRNIERRETNRLSKRPDHTTNARARHVRMPNDKASGRALLTEQLDPDIEDEFSDGEASSPFLDRVRSDIQELPPTSRKRMALYGLVAVVVLGLFLMLLHSGWLGPLFMSILSTVHKLGPWGPIVLLLLIIVLVPTCIPTTPLNIGAGFLFGWPGLPVITSGAVIGASISFWISRRLYAEAAERRLRDVKMYHTLNMLLAEDQGKFTWRSLKIILLTRASPLFPFPLINYACGLTRVSYSSYALGTLVGMVPWHIIDIYIGTWLTSLSQIEEGHSKSYMIAVLVFTLVMTGIVTIFAKRMLRSMEAATKLEKNKLEGAYADDDALDADVEMEIMV